MFSREKSRQHARPTDMTERVSWSSGVTPARSAVTESVYFPSCQLHFRCPVFLVKMSRWGFGFLEVPQTSCIKAARKSGEWPSLSRVQENYFSLLRWSSERALTRAAPSYHEMTV